tara:strand:+ start:405 stop:635 length:231 start_codon:yes stop_codon:yes gene_type:complete
MVPPRHFSRHPGSTSVSGLVADADCRYSFRDPEPFGRFELGDMGMFFLAHVAFYVSIDLQAHGSVRGGGWLGADHG